MPAGQFGTTHIGAGQQNDGQEQQTEEQAVTHDIHSGIGRIFYPFIYTAANLFIGAGMSNPDQDTKPFAKASAVEYYESKRYKSSLQRRVDAREQATLRNLLRDHVGEGDKRVLDLPSGYGRFSPLFHGLGYSVTSMDISDAMTDYVRQRPDFGPKDHAEPADVRKGLPLADASIDVTCCIRLFQHFHYPEWRQEALREFARVSKRHVMVTFYDKACVHYWTKRLLAAIKGKPARVQMISRAQFEADAAAAGLKVVEYRPWLPRVHAQTFTMLEKI